LQYGKLSTPTGFNAPALAYEQLFSPPLSDPPSRAGAQPNAPASREHDAMPRRDLHVAALSNALPISGPTPADAAALCGRR